MTQDNTLPTIAALIEAGDIPKEYLISSDQISAVWRKEHAVLHLDGWVFLPCWECQDNGWKIIKAPRLFKFLRFIGVLK